jgi:GH15 family glucan-1,4-alpha-glucosidase
MSAPDPAIGNALDQAFDLRKRSLEIILANQDPGGAFIASPTFGQYRYSWLRDGGFIAEALDLAGEADASRRFHEWVARVVLGSAAGIERSIEAGRRGRRPDAGDYMPCRYRVDGSPGPDDWPTFQLDGPGIWLWSLEFHRKRGGPVAGTLTEAAQLVARYLAALPDSPCYDAWEEWPDRVHTSTRAAILAGLRAAASLGVADDSVTLAVGRLEDELVERPPDVYTKWGGSDAVDASLLWIVAPYGLVEPSHPTFARTLRRIEAELVSSDSGVHRYRDDTYYGGGAWMLLTAGLGRVYLRRGEDGDVGRARRAHRWIQAQADARGFLPEQIPDDALHPERIDEWRARWGESARPLLWSHASFVALDTELAAAW